MRRTWAKRISKEARMRRRAEKHESLANRTHLMDEFTGSECTERRGMGNGVLGVCWHPEVREMRRLQKQR